MERSGVKKGVYMCIVRAGQLSKAVGTRGIFLLGNVSKVLVSSWTPSRRRRWDRLLNPSKTAQKQRFLDLQEIQEVIGHFEEFKAFSKAMDPKILDQEFSQLSICSVPQDWRIWTFQDIFLVVSSSPISPGNRFFWGEQLQRNAVCSLRRLPASPPLQQ